MARYYSLTGEIFNPANPPPRTAYQRMRDVALDKLTIPATQAAGLVGAFHAATVCLELGQTQGLAAAAGAALGCVVWPAWSHVSWGWNAYPSVLGAHWNSYKIDTRPEDNTPPLRPELREDVRYFRDMNAALSGCMAVMVGGIGTAVASFADEGKELLELIPAMHCLPTFLSTTAAYLLTEHPVQCARFHRVMRGDWTITDRTEPDEEPQPVFSPA